MQRNVALIILYSQNKILLQRRSPNNPRFPGKLLLVGGGIEEGETPLEAIKREMIEETNYHLHNPQKFSEIHSDKGDKHIFIEEYDHRQKLQVLIGDALEWHEVTKELAKEFLESDGDLYTQILQQFS